MKSILRALFINAAVLFLATRIYPGLIFDGQLKTLILATLALTILNRFVKPIIKLLLLPINLITLGLFGWVAQVLTLFLLTRLVTGFAVVPFYFPGWSNNGFVVPAMAISSFASYLIASITISILAQVLGWLFRH